MTARETARAWLEMFYSDVQGAVADRFYKIARKFPGTEPKKLCSLLFNQLQEERDQLAERDEKDGDGIKHLSRRGIQLSMRRRPDLALAYMEFVIEQDRRPAGERAADREEMQEIKKREWMSSQAPTEKQLKFLAAEEPGQPPPANRLEASLRIDQIIKNNPR